MTIQVDNRETSIYDTNGLIKSFPYDFPAFRGDNGQKGLEVRFIDDLGYSVVDPSEFTVIQNTENTGGVVQFYTAPVSGKKIIIVGNTPIDQQLDITNYSRFNGESIEANFDKIIAIAQEFLSKLNEEIRQRINNDLDVKDFAEKKMAELQAWATSQLPELARDQFDLMLNDFKEEWEDALNLITNSLGIPAKVVIDDSGASQQEVNDLGGVKYWVFKTKGYKLHNEVRLDNGDVVRSTTPNNTTNPNIDMAGWVSTQSMALSAPLWGLKGDGTDEQIKLLTLLRFANTSNLAVNLTGLTITTSPLIVNFPVRFIGRGGIKLKSGSNAILLDSSSDIIIEGEITLDPDLLNNSGGTIGNETHCAIKHSGANLILKGAKIKPSASNNIVSRATGKIICRDLEVGGGRVCLHLIPRPDVKVDIIGGTYKNASMYDNVQVLNGSDVNIRGITSHSASRSGIVVNNTTNKARIIGNNCYANKKDTGNQGGWGIVASVDTYDTIVSGNTCKGNQNGGISIDTYPAAGVTPLDNRIVVQGNIVDGEFEGGYSTTGISLNGATHSIVNGNNIRKVGQGIHTENAKYASITGNEVQDVTGFFVQLNKSHGSVVEGGNIFDGCSNTSNGAINLIDTDDAKVSGNNIINLTGVNGNVFRVAGTSKDWEISNNKITRSVAGGGFVFHILGAANTGGVIKGNNVNGKVTDAFQWYLVSDNAAEALSVDNIIKGIAKARYIFQGTNITAGNDTISGSYNAWDTAPTSFKSRTGQVVSVAGVLKNWNGTAWV